MCYTHIHQLFGSICISKSHPLNFTDSYARFRCIKSEGTGDHLATVHCYYGALPRRYMYYPPWLNVYPDHLPQADKSSISVTFLRCGHCITTPLPVWHHWKVIVQVYISVLYSARGLFFDTDTCSKSIVRTFTMVICTYFMLFEMYRYQVDINNWLNVILDVLRFNIARDSLITLGADGRK